MGQQPDPRQKDSKILLGIFLPKIPSLLLWTWVLGLGHLGKTHTMSILTMESCVSHQDLASSAALWGTLLRVLGCQFSLWHSSCLYCLIFNFL